MCSLFFCCCFLHTVLYREHVFVYNAHALCTHVQLTYNENERWNLFFSPCICSTFVVFFFMISFCLSFGYFEVHASTILELTKTKFQFNIHIWFMVGCCEFLAAHFVFRCFFVIWWFGFRFFFAACWCFYMCKFVVVVFVFHCRRLAFSTMLKQLLTGSIQNLNSSVYLIENHWNGISLQCFRVCFGNAVIIAATAQLFFLCHSNHSIEDCYHDFCIGKKHYGIKHQFNSIHN